MRAQNKMYAHKFQIQLKYWPWTIAKVFQTNCTWTKIATSHKNSHYSWLVFSKKFYPAQLKI